ncbi:hypothetical protein [Paenibacillus taichungensis]|uniref:hypothetical protein n=1 Tax=Paenibacillus taichungensis TaxID=484184 RepID=UPI0039A044FB
MTISQHGDLLGVPIKYKNQVYCDKNYCSLPIVPEREFNADVNPNRREVIAQIDRKWVNGTVLHYYFFDKETDGEYVFMTSDDVLDGKLLLLRIKCPSTLFCGRGQIQN